jgi:fucose permease
VAEATAQPTQTSSEQHSAKAFSAIDQRALLAVAVMFFLNGAVFAAFMPRLPEIRNRVGLSLGELGFLLAVAGLAGVGASAVVGPAIERFGTRRVVLGSGTVLSASLPLIGFAQGRILFIVGLVLMLSFDVLVDVAMNLQASWLSARRHTPVMNRLHGLWSLGTVVGGFSSSRVAAAGVSLPTHLLISSAILLATLIGVGQQLLRVDERPAGTEAEDTEMSTHAPNKRFSPALVLFVIGGLFAVAIEHTSMNWATFRFTEDFSTSVGFAALGYVAMTGGMTFGRFSGDWLLVRLGTQRLLYLALGSGAAGLVLATLVPNRYFNLFGFVLVGLGAATMLPRLYDMAAQFKGRTGMGLAALTVGVRLGIVLSPLVVGALANSSLSTGQAIAIVSLPALAGFFVVMKAA